VGAVGFGSAPTPPTPQTPIPNPQNKIYKIKK